jgi:hypothetical protein
MYWYHTSVAFFSGVLDKTWFGSQTAGKTALEHVFHFWSSEKHCKNERAHIGTKTVQNGAKTKKNRAKSRRQ